MPSYNCSVCQAAFEVPEATLAKYPNWVPRFCMKHRNAGKQSGASSAYGNRSARTTPWQQASGTAPAVMAASTVASNPGADSAGDGEPAVAKPVEVRRVPPGHAYGSRTFSRTSARQREVLTTQEVLERYTAGPSSGVFTDGGCDPNPGQGGWGVVHVEQGEIVYEACGGDRDTTNNRMELSAIIHALERLPANAEVTVFSDSELCVKTLTEWAKGWKRSGWSRKGGKPIANLDLVIRAYDAVVERPGVKMQWIKAHDGSRWNEYADALATKGQRNTK
jgi:ribonuclease HI